MFVICRLRMRATREDFSGSMPAFSSCLKNYRPAMQKLIVVNGLLFMKSSNVPFRALNEDSSVSLSKLVFSFSPLLSLSLSLPLLVSLPWPLSSWNFSRKKALYISVLKSTSKTSPLSDIFFFFFPIYRLTNFLREKNGRKKTTSANFIFLGTRYEWKLWWTIVNSKNRGESNFSNRQFTKK